MFGPKINFKFAISWFRPMRPHGRHFVYPANWNRCGNQSPQTCHRLQLLYQHPSSTVSKHDILISHPLSLQKAVTCQAGEIASSLSYLNVPVFECLKHDTVLVSRWRLTDDAYFHYQGQQPDYIKNFNEFGDLLPLVEPIPIPCWLVLSTNITCTNIYVTADFVVKHFIFKLGTKLHHVTEVCFDIFCVFCVLCNGLCAHK